MIIKVFIILYLAFPHLGEELAEVLWFGLVGDVAYKEGGGALTFRGTSGGVARHGLRV